MYSSNLSYGPSKRLPEIMSALKNAISDWLFLRTLRVHGSRLGWRDAGKYSDYLRQARRQWLEPRKPRPEIARAIDDYAKNRFASFSAPESVQVASAIAAKIDARMRNGENVWKSVTDDGSTEEYIGRILDDFPDLQTLIEGPLGEFLEGHFESYFKLFYAKLYRSKNRIGGPTGSSLWHSDGGPGTCVNVMFYIDDTAPENGPLEVLPWLRSMRVFASERAQMRLRLPRESNKRLSSGERREARCVYYGERIAAMVDADIAQPTGRAGLIVPFSNNTIHRGGHPHAGYTRRAIVIHCYPAATPLVWNSLKARGLSKFDNLGKSYGFPQDPAEMF
jgi:hypothetical protein